MDEGCKIVEHLRDLLEDLNHHEKLPSPLLFNDNLGSVQWAHSEAITRRMRHHGIRQVAVRDAIRNQKIHVGHIPGRLNTADIFTKEFKDAQHHIDLVHSILSPREMSA